MTKSSGRLHRFGWPIGLCTILISAAVLAHEASLESPGEGQKSMSCLEQTDALEGIWRIFQVPPGAPGNIGEIFPPGHRIALQKEVDVNGKFNDRFYGMTYARQDPASPEWVGILLTGQCVDNTLYVLSPVDPGNELGMRDIELCLHQVSVVEDAYDDWCNDQYQAVEESVLFCSAVTKRGRGDYRIALSTKGDPNSCSVAAANKQFRTPGHAHGGNGDL